MSVCLSVTLVYCGQTVGRTKMPLGMEVGLGPGHTALDLDPAPPTKGAQLPQFSAHVCCEHTAGWIKMPLGTELGLAQTTLCYMGIQLPKKGAQQPLPDFLVHVYCGQMAG